jgi:hypothetical protein
MGLPIPPYQKLFDFLLFIDVLKILNNAVVEAFRVSDSVRSGEDGCGAESESSLPRVMSSS